MPYEHLSEMMEVSVTTIIHIAFRWIKIT